ncbi:MAG: DUF4870 domain-containing protein [Verrucomicrobiota bacterium]
MESETGKVAQDFYPPSTGPGALPRPDERTWAVGAHLASVAGWVGIPMGHILAPLVVWLIKKDESEYARIQALESLNFQISMTLYALGSAVLAVTIIGLVVAIPALIALVIGDVILTIIGALAASRGESYRYPMTIRLLR